MSWLQLTLTAGKPEALALETLLEEAGAVSVSLTDAGDEPLLEPKPGEAPIWTEVNITALFEADANATALREFVTDQFPASAATLKIEELADREWLTEWQRDAKPLNFGGRLWVVPDEQLATGDMPVTVVLEPGLAFGTGDHPTTSMCLNWLDAQDLSGKTVMDYGCGSGLLALAALKLGASRAFGTDIDDQAVTASRRNAERNQVSEQFTVWTAGEEPDQQYDLVVANILSGILIELSSTLTGQVCPGGELVLTGILATQADAVIAAYPDFDMLVARENDGWVLITGRKRNSTA